jgi:tight adherence protein C
MILLAVLGLLLAGAAVGFAAWAVILPRTRAAARVRDIASYGFAGVPGAPVLPSGSRSLGNSLAISAGRLADTIARVTGGVREDNLRRELMAAGLFTTSPRLVAGYRVMAAASGIVLGLSLGLLPSLAGRVVTAALLAWLGWLAPLVVVRRRARARMDEIDRRMPDLIDLMVVTVEGGVGFAGSLQIAAGRIDGPLGDELRLALQEQRMGASMSGSLHHMLERADVPAVRSFVRAVDQGSDLGVSIATIMRNLAVEMRKRRRMNAEERAQKAPVKMLFPLVFLIFPALGIVLVGPAAFELFDAFGGL